MEKRREPRRLEVAKGSDGLANACVTGQGRIGLPLALLLARAGHKVVRAWEFDLDLVTTS